MKVERIALHQLYLSPQKEILSNHQPFEVEAYSKFKYGDTSVACRYGEMLAQKTIQNLFSLTLSNSNIALTSSAYRYTPTAAQSIADAFFDYFKNYTSLELEYFKIHRTYLDGRDYAQLTPQERNEVLQRSNLTLDENQSLKGKTVWVIDDVRITGKHEEKILHFLEQEGVKEVLCLYVGILEQGLELSWVEHYLNHAWVKDIYRFAEIVHQPHFKINARVCKFLLSYPSVLELKYFFDSLSEEKINLFYQVAKNDAFDKIPTYQASFYLLENVYKRNKSLYSLFSEE